MNKPCPKCGSSQLRYIETSTAGHGDSTWSGRVECLNCHFGLLRLSGWGTGGDPMDAFKEWNKLVRSEPMCEHNETGETQNWIDKFITVESAVFVVCLAVVLNVLSTVIWLFIFIVMELKIGNHG